MFYRKSILAAFLGLIFLSFFGTLAVSACLFPQPYDWRRRVISNLLSPRDNPGHYWLATGGVALTGLFMLPFAGYLQRNLQLAAPKTARLSASAFLIGSITLICAALVAPQHQQPVFGTRLHELLARSAAGLLIIGMLASCWCAWRGRGVILPARLFWTWSLVTLMPLAGLVGSECLLLLAQMAPGMGKPIRGALRHSMFWHLGFWEWTGAVAAYAFLCAAVFLIPSPPSER